MHKYVVHCKKSRYDVYIGRGNGSIWGNPFVLNNPKNDAERDEVLEKYKKWIMTQPELLSRVKELKGKVLGCWCAPRKCHGDVLAELANDEV